MNDAFVHAKRLERDYLLMMQLQGPVITWQSATVANPAQRSYPSVYNVTYHILAPTSHGDRNSHTIEINCSSLDYPGRQPDARFLTPVLKHPHSFNNGKICLGGFPIEESLAALCIRLGRFFTYDPNIINPNSIASNEFNDWYRTNRTRLPLQRVVLPQLDEENASGRGGFTVKSRSSSSTPPGQAGQGMTIKRRT